MHDAQEHRRSRLLRYAASGREALADNARHSFAADHALIVYRTGAIYSMIPKNACTSFRYSLALANGCIDGPEDFAWIHRNNRTFAASPREIACAPFTFVVLRDPLARLASVYLDKIVSRREQFWGLFDTMKDVTNPDAVTFRKFVDALTEPFVIGLDIHWRRQANFLVYRDYDLYLDFDEIAEGAAAVAERAGMEFFDTRELAGHDNARFERVEGGPVPDLPPN
ncbi:MAG: sulfotransferase family 2 domain-containing protein, partial [Pseudomonadota bacterium]